MDVEGRGVVTVKDFSVGDHDYGGIWSYIRENPFIDFNLK